VETDKGHHYFVAGWRGLRSWVSFCVAEGGSNTPRCKCQQSNCSANELHRACFSGRDHSIAVWETGMTRRSEVSRPRSGHYRIPQSTLALQAPHCAQWMKRPCTLVVLGVHQDRPAVDA
jgi:hypothetical protein